MPKCPICDYDNPEGTTACRECGSDLSAAPPPDTGTPEPIPVAVPVAAPAAGGTAACPSCGAENPAEAKFCKTCGKPMAAAPPAPPIEEPAAEPPPATIACPSCGAENPGGGKFCKGCGKSLAAPPPEEKAPEPEAPAPEPAPEPPPPPPEPVCSKCGAKIAAGMKFCGECGTPVGAPAEEPAEPAPPSGPRLVINPDDEATVVVLTKDETTLNRSEEADVVLKDGYVSSHHAVVTKKDDGYWIKDVGSTNGTFIQVRSEILLKPGDVLKLGQTLVRFED
jgi:hypothetical protein